MQTVLERELILPREDMMFKNIFGREENLHILEDLLSSVLKIPKKRFKNITLINTEQNPDFRNGKKTICDVKVRLENNETIIVEMQKSSHMGLEDRMLLYNAKAFTDSVERGNKYIKINKTITILFIDSKLFHDDATDYHDIFYMKSTKHDRIFSKKQEIHVIELGKVTRGKYPWYDFMKAENMEEMKMAAEQNPVINDAVRVVNYFNEDEMFRYNALREMLAEIDEQYRMKDATDRGILQVAQNLIKMKMEISFITEATGLSEEQIIDISNSMGV